MDTMALWSNDTRLSHDVYTVVYLLKDALRSAVEDAWFFERNDCPKPDVKGAGHAEIFARLGRFRDNCTMFKEREALMLTKILRAREWAAELRKVSPDLQDDIDQFLDATEQCYELQAEFINDPQQMFHGGSALSRFSLKQAMLDASDGADGPEARGYLIGGHTEVFELRAACEVFLSQINDEFFTAASELPDAPQKPASFLAYLEAAEEPAQPVH